jgi:5-methylcytosine-specific restriction endonuclease McrA
LGPLTNQLTAIRRMADAIVASKVCTKCGVNKPLSEFHKKKSTKDGLQCACKVCILAENAAYKNAHREESSAYNKAYYAQNREKVLAYGSQWAKDNKEKVNARAKRYRDRNPERAKESRAKYDAANRDKNLARCKRYRESNPAAVLAMQEKWREANKGRIAAYNSTKYAANQAEQIERSRKWREANPEAVAAMCRLRRARRLAAGGTHTVVDIERLLVEQGHRCANPHCRADLVVVKRELDHKHPLSRGGSDGPENLQWLCAPCNRRKHAKPMEEWLAAEERRSRKAA